MGAPSGSTGNAGELYPEGHARANQVMVVLGGQPVCFIDGIPYLNCETDPETGLPLHDPMAHVYRQGDPKPDFEHRGLLTQISQDDLKDTDLYVFRTATGGLILKREGLDKNEIDAEAGGFALDLVIPGGGAYAAFSAGPGGSNLEAWQRDLGLEEEFVGRMYNMDSLRTGESVTLVAINRPTGYLGIAQGVLNAGLGGQIFNGTGMMSARFENFLLLPPNLSISAKRTRKDDEEFQIGFEGAALTDDTLIQVTTQWTGPNGQPIPPDLDGYTGRLARIIQPNLLAPERIAGNDVGTFDIEPGTHQQVLKFKGDITGPEHFYIHVSGSDQYNASDFSACQDCEGILKYRPETYVPVKVAIPDVKRTRAVQREDEDAPGIYQWMYRPEMQFSAFELEQLMLQQGGGEAPNQQDLLELEDSEAIDLTTLETAQILHQVLESDFDPLQLFGPTRELLLGLGDGEYALCLVEESSGEECDDIELSGGEIEGILQSADGALALALYLGSDPANRLWDLGLKPGGLQVAYDMLGTTYVIEPDEPDTPAMAGFMRATAADAEEPVTIYRTLGGMRINLRYNAPEGGIIQDQTWIFEETPGYFCQTEGVDPAVGECTEAKLKFAVNDDSGIYWQPEEDWWSFPEGKDKRIANGKVIVNILINDDTQEIERPFQVQSRVLRPQPDDPMEGEDVAILENMLWLMGVSPQYPTNANNPNSGKAGARINSDRGYGLGWTHTCQGEKAERRDVYYTGWSDGSCSKGLVSMEGMVKRYQARNTVRAGVHGNDNATNSGRSPINGVDGIVDDDMLGWLRRDWTHYYEAYTTRRPAGIINKNSPLMDAWLSAALKIWDEGLGDNVPPTYTQARHEAMLISVGLSPDWKSRVELLRDWKLQESDSHWGKGSPQTDYRMTEGSGDEMGSLSFNQVLYRYRYGATPCTVHAEAGLNYFDPLGNLKGFMVHLGARPAKGSGEVNCPGGFYATYATANDPRIPYNRDDLIGYRQNGEFHAIGEKEDDYELLSRAIGSYNGGNFWDGYSWPVLLARTTFTEIIARSNEVPSTGTGTCSSCTYSINVKNDRYGLPYRTYVWVGARYPATQPDGTPHPQAGQPEWCFAYGEQEWRAGETFEDVFEDAEGNVARGIPPRGRKNCVTGENL